MYLEIITPDQKIYEGDVDLVQVPGSKGSFEILTNHAPIISTLDNGKVKIIETSKRGQKFFRIAGGLIEVLNNHIIILAEKILN